MQLVDFLSAYNHIKPYIYHTPLDLSLGFSSEQQNVYLKLECQQKTKSFKIRGALNKILQLGPADLAKGLYTISSGNHGSAVSYAAGMLGIENALVYVPEVTPASKVNKIKHYGAKVIIKGKDYDECHAIGLEEMENSGMIFIDPYDKDYDIYAGAGTVSLEVLFERPEIDTILVPLSGGGLATGIGLAAKSINPNVQVIGVQTEACPAFYHSFYEGVFYPEYPCTESVCEALMGGVGVEPFKHCHESMDAVLVVKEDTIRAATRKVFDVDHVLCEPSSAIGLAAIMEHPDKINGKNIAVIVSGGNVSEEYFKVTL